MEVKATFSDKMLAFDATPSKEDIEFTLNKKGKLARRRAEFYLPEGFSEWSIHPDALCLLALIVYGPFAKRNFDTSWPISEKFASIVEASLKKEVRNLDRTIDARSAPLFGRDALAFSGGVDSVAALELLPDDALPIFMRRVVPPGERVGIYRADAALRSCEMVRESGRDVSVVDTTMEYVRDPVGFSVDWTNAAGAVLFCDYQRLRSVSFGMIQESAFLLGHGHFSDLESRSIYSSWAPVFKCIGLPICLPTAGLSEVVTSKIADSVSDKWMAQSCVRGGETEPCGKCFKCFRKKLLDARLFGKKIFSDHFEIARSSKEVKRRLLEVPVHHENVLAFSLHGLDSEPSPILGALLDKTRLIYEYSERLTCLECYNTRGLKFVPEFLQGSVHRKIGKFAKDATEHELKILEQWETTHLTELGEYRNAQARLLELLG